MVITEQRGWFVKRFSLKLKIQFIVVASEICGNCQKNENKLVIELRFFVAEGSLLVSLDATKCNENDFYFL